MILEEKLLDNFKVDQTEETNWNDNRNKCCIETTHPDDIDDECVSQGKLNMLSLKNLISLLLTILEITFLEEKSFDALRKLGYCYY